MSPALFIRRPGPHDAADGGLLHVRRDGLRPPAGERSAQRGLPDHPGHRLAARRQPGDDGLGGGHAAGAAVHDDRRHRLDDVDERAGVSQITIQFTLSRDIDAAAQDVQAAITKAAPLLPPGMPTPPSYQKVNPADQPVLYLALSSPTLPLYTVDEYAQTTWPSASPPSAAWPRC